MKNQKEYEKVAVMNVAQWIYVLLDWWLAFFVVREQVRL